MMLWDPQWVGLSISQDLSNFMAYGVKILAHSGQMHNLGILCILVKSFDTLGYFKNGQIFKNGQNFKKSPKFQNLPYFQKLPKFSKIANLSKIA